MIAIVSTQGQTLSQFAESIMPGWRFPEDWLAWPPDIFALTSAVLSRTGAYRHVIEAPWSRNALWQREAEAAAQAWMTTISRALSPQRRDEPEEEHLGQAVLDQVLDAVLKHAGTLTLEQLRTLEDPPAVEFAEALLKLHAIADEACTGFGVMGPMRSESALAHCLANLLLTAKGSLSQLPKHAGVVLPKLRTPQQGLTLRSLSHHVTYHLTEVEVMWRAMPWPNVDENTINILAIPWPPEVQTLHFQPRGDTFQTVRYFSYRPEQNDSALPVDRIVALVQKIQAEHCRIHLIVFPECALTVPEYRRLLAALKEARLHEDVDLKRVPMVLAGVHRHDEESDFNEVHLAAYYAERWYELAQRKHHRWRLDRNQIRQYGLEGRLATARSWYENITLGQRRLTFLVPNGWLALCPLICEDLAQLEPVSEVIRGVGPTLLLSLLADGPQLPQRWSARYASVFADDPGTAVLTLSSLGMVQKSQRLDGGPPQPASRTVGLWKDQIMGWNTIDLPEKCDAVLLTVSAELREEYTADGRGDHQSAAAFRYEGVRGFDLPIMEASTKGGGTGVAAVEREQAGDGSGAQDRLVADWGDIRELSAATFAINALLHLRRADDVELVLHWLLANPDADHKPLGDERLRGLIRQVIESERDPKSAGISPGPQEQWPTESLRRAADAIGAFFTGTADADPQFWTRLVDEACSRLERYRRNGGEDDPHRRVERIIPYSVLTCTYGFLERLRRRRTPRHGEMAKKASSGAPPPLETADAAKLFKRVELALEEFSY